MKDRIAREFLSRIEELIAASTACLESLFDSLHEEVAKFRAGTEWNHDGLSSRFNGLESRLTDFETKVYLRFDAVDARFDGLEGRLALVERRT